MSLFVGQTRSIRANLDARLVFRSIVPFHFNPLLRPSQYRSLGAAFDHVDARMQELESIAATTHSIKAKCEKRRAQIQYALLPVGACPEELISEVVLRVVRLCDVSTLISVVLQHVARL